MEVPALISDGHQLNVSRHDAYRLITGFARDQLTDLSIGSTVHVWKQWRQTRNSNVVG